MVGSVTALYPVSAEADLPCAGEGRYREGRPHPVAFLGLVIWLILALARFEIEPAGGLFQVFVVNACDKAANATVEHLAIYIKHGTKISPTSRKRKCRLFQEKNCT